MERPTDQIVTLYRRVRVEQPEKVNALRHGNWKTLDGPKVL